MNYVIDETGKPLPFRHVFTADRDKVLLVELPAILDDEGLMQWQRISLVNHVSIVLMGPGASVTEMDDEALETLLAQRKAHKARLRAQRRHQAAE